MNHIKRLLQKNKRGLRLNLLLAVSSIFSGTFSINPKKDKAPNAFVHEKQKSYHNLAQMGFLFVRYYKS
ncbi:MAG: hypothetical protein C0430_10625 [Flavobacterium sp.]|nr:hypothetical protein [Flavobacterium sp.]